MRIIQYTIVWGMLAISLTACSSKKNDEDNKATSAKATKVAIVDVDECLPLIVAEHLGLLDSLHADVKLIRKGSIAECKQAVENGEADACVNDQAIGYKLITAKKARIKRISQLNDKVIAADREGHSFYMARMAVDSLMKALQPVFIIQVENIRVRLNMLITSNIDAAILPEPYASRAVNMGNYEIKVKAKSNSKSITEMQQPLLTKKIAKLKEPLSIAHDSIRRFGKENYERIWK